MKNVRFSVGVALAVWLALILILGAAGIFNTPGAPPLPLLFGVATPILIFVALYRTASGFRDFVLAADLRLTTGVQAWRFGGLGFLALYANGVLPGMFALPAGLGDMAIGFAAPWLVVALVQRPAFAAGKRFMAWNLLGLLDLAVAMTTGVLGSGIIIGLAPEITTAPMGRLPLVLIPCYLVPLFIMLHLTAIFQSRRLAKAVRAPGQSTADTPGAAAKCVGSGAVPAWACRYCS